MPIPPRLVRGSPGKNEECRWAPTSRRFSQGGASFQLARRAKQARSLLYPSAGRAPALLHFQPRSEEMAILIDETKCVLVQGITGREGQARTRISMIARTTGLVALRRK